MIADVAIGGVLIPGLLVLACLALVATFVMIRVLAALGIYRLFIHRPLVDLATFAIIYGLLVQHLPPIGLLP